MERKEVDFGNIPICNQKGYSYLSCLNILEWLKKIQLGQSKWTDRLDEEMNPPHYLQLQGALHIVIVHVCLCVQMNFFQREHRQDHPSMHYLSPLHSYSGSQKVQKPLFSFQISFQYTCIWIQTEEVISFHSSMHTHTCQHTVFPPPPIVQTASLQLWDSEDGVKSGCCAALQPLTTIAFSVSTNKTHRSADRSCTLCLMILFMKDMRNYPHNDMCILLSLCTLALIWNVK